MTSQKYYQDVLSLYTLDNKYYAVPKDYDTIGLWYNKTLFDKAGVSYPDDTWTWDDMYNAAVKLTDKANGIYGYAANSDEQPGQLVQHGLLDGRICRFMTI